MLNRLIEWSINQRFLVIVMAVIWTAVGLYLANNSNVDVFPEFAPPQVVVQNEAPGMVAEEVETLVTLPLEVALNGMPGLTHLRSASLVGVSTVTAVFSYGTDIYRARQLVTERLQIGAPNLPQGIGSPTILPAMPAIGDILKIGLVSEKISPMQLRTLADWDIRNRILAVPGVARVLIIGGEKREFQVLVNPVRLQAYQVTLDEVERAVQDSNAVSAGGFVVTPDQQLSVQGQGRPKDVYEIGKSVVAVRQGVPVLLEHIAAIEIKPAFKIGDTVINGRTGVYIYVTKQPGVNTIQLTEKVEQAISELRQSLPKDIEFVYIFRQADFIQKSVSSVLIAIGQGGILVVIVLLVFLLNWRSSIISLTAIPLSILTAVLAIKFLGGSINTMTLGGLAIAVGEVVDDAIIDVENVYRRLRENRLSDDPKPVYLVIYEACTEVRSSVVYATFIVGLVFLPVFLLQGVEGQIFAPLGQSYIIAILASLFVALTVTPAMCMYFLSSNKVIPRNEPWTVARIQEVYSVVLSRVMDKPKTVLIGAVILFLLSLGLLPFMGQAFLPHFRENSLIITTIGRAGQSLEATTRIGASLEKNLLAHGDVAAAAQWAGRAELDDMSGGSNFSEFDVRLKDSNEPLDRILDEIREHLEEIPGVVSDVGSFISHRIDEVLSGGTRAGIAIKIFGPDLPVLRQLGDRVSTELKKVPGAVDVRSEPQVVVPRISIRINREKAARYGITARHLINDVETAFHGRVTSQILEGQRLFPLRVWLDEPYRHNFDLLKKLLIDAPTGARVPIGEIADIQLIEGPNVIVREDVGRRMVVQANTSGRDVVSVVEEARKRLAKSVVLPAGYYLVYSGQYAAQKEASQTLLWSSALTFVGILLLLNQALGSWKLTAVVASNLPLAAIGGLLVVALTGNVMSIGTLIGFISLFGISNRNTILLASHINDLIHKGVEFEEAIFRGCMHRVAPVLMTALTAALGMLPLAVGTGAGSELEQPLAIVIVGGMYTSTALTLIVVPALFKIFMRPPAVKLKKTSVV
ncbi:efflux RND transporter permease subunit [bacterium]|nr:efflux RND transporter permease subunit [bacterium]MBP9808960.1 efflux RND transporter permease subunit [bacterium]